MSDKTIGELFAELTDAEETLKVAQFDARRARHHEGNCLNRVNELQKAIDEKIAAAKAASVSGTDWSRA